MANATTPVIQINEGNVGIATTSPGTFLQLGSYPVSGTYVNIATYPDIPSEHMMHLTAPSTTGYYGGGISFGENAFTAANITAIDAGGGGALHLAFGTGSASGMTERLRITNDGNVGIGTTAPDNKLTVKAANCIIDAQSTADSQTIGFRAGYLNHGTLAGFFRYTTGDAQLYIDNEFVGNNAVYSDINFRNKTTGGTLTTRMKIKGSTGNVGIGTTSPDSPLSIKGGTGLGVGASGIRVHRPDAFGQFGFFDYGQSSGTTYIGSSYTGGTAAQYGAITFRQLSNGGSAKDTMTINQFNNVGIGTTSPTAKLDINGNVRYRGDIYSEFTFNGSGNYSSGTNYTIASTGQLTSNGMYQLVMYLDDYGAGGGTYFSWFCSVPFYWVTTGTNRTVSQSLPPLIGTGHAIGTIPTFTITQELGTQGGQAKIRFNPKNNWTGLNGASSKTFIVYVKRIGG